MSRALVVLSGGQDSTICLFKALSENDHVECVTFNYGQRHVHEVDAAVKVAQMAGVEAHEIIHVGKLLRSSSPLTSDNPLETYIDFASMDQIIGDRVELTFVPMRNAFFLTLAANIAISKNIHTVYTGVCEADNANYPDCRAAFINAQEDAINQALGISDFRIMTPLIRLTKAESIELAKLMPGCMDALAYSHTCYAGEYPPCGKCHACVLRAEGFRQAGVDDPLIVRAQLEMLAGARA